MLCIKDRKKVSVSRKKLMQELVTKWDYKLY